MGTSKVSHYLTSADCKRVADRGGARTLNLLVRSQVLYIPVELRDQIDELPTRQTDDGRI